MNGWVGFDFDATLVTYEGWRGIDHVGDPVPPMVQLVKKYLAEGVEVRIFTARVHRTVEMWPPQSKSVTELRELYEQVTKVSTTSPTRYHTLEWIEAELSYCLLKTWCQSIFGRPLEITCVKDKRMVKLYDDRCVQVEPNTGRLIQDC